MQYAKTMMSCRCFEWRKLLEWVALARGDSGLVETRESRRE